MTTEQTIHTTLNNLLDEQGIVLNGTLEPNLVLLESGLDSLSFAILVSELEGELGYDPFVLMESPVYPTTLGEFINIYEQFKP